MKEEKNVATENNEEIASEILKVSQDINLIEEEPVIDNEIQSVQDNSDIADDTSTLKEEEFPTDIIAENVEIIPEEGTFKEQLVENDTSEITEKEELQPPVENQNTASTNSDCPSSSEKLNCDCNEEQKKQTKILDKMYHYLKLSFTSFKKHWITFTALSAIIGIISFVYEITKPDPVKEMTTYLDNLKLDEQYHLHDSLSVIEEVRNLYRIQNDIEILRLTLARYPQNVESTSKSSEDNYNKYIAKCQDYNAFISSLKDQLISLVLSAQSFYFENVNNNYTSAVFKLEDLNNFSTFQEEFNEAHSEFNKAVDELTEMVENKDSINQIVLWHEFSKYSSIIEDIMSKPIYRDYFEFIGDYFSGINCAINIRLHEIENAFITGTYYKNDEQAYEEEEIQLEEN